MMDSIYRMGVFKEFIERDSFVEKLINEFDQGGDAVPDRVNQTGKLWSAKKDDILKMWQNLRPDIPIMITPMDTTTDHDSYGEDGIRISGSYNFITTVLGRIKDLAAYENPQTKLRLIFRGVDTKRNPSLNRPSYVFYLNLEKRSRKRPGRPAKKAIPTL